MALRRRVPPAEAFQVRNVMLGCTAVFATARLWRHPLVDTRIKQENATRNRKSAQKTFHRSADVTAKLTPTRARRMQVALRSRSQESATPKRRERVSRRRRNRGRARRYQIGSSSIFGTCPLIWWLPSTRSQSAEIWRRRLVPVTRFNFKVVSQMSRKIESFACVKADVLLLGGSRSPK